MGEGGAFKKFDFSQISMTMSHILFWGLKMTTICIQNPKIIVTDDYQQFLAHFDWFLSLFQISDVKPVL